MSEEGPIPASRFVLRVITVYEMGDGTWDMVDDDRGGSPIQVRGANGLGRDEAAEVVAEAIRTPR